MNRLTRTALDFLKEHETAFITSHATTLDGRRKKDRQLYINLHTAAALVRRDLATESTDEKGYELIRIVEQAS